MTLGARPSYGVKLDDMQRERSVEGTVRRHVVELDDLLCVT